MALYNDVEIKIGFYVTSHVCHSAIFSLRFGGRLVIKPPSYLTFTVRGIVSGEAVFALQAGTVNAFDGIKPMTQYCTQVF